MHRAARRRFGLAVGVVALAALAWWSVARQPPAAPETLLPLDPAAITRIEVRAGTHATRRFEKRADGWWMTTPRLARADDAHVERLADIAAATVLGWRPASDFDAARIGLARPFATLRLDGRELVFGGLAALAPQRYVRVGDHVALIAAQHGTDLAATPDTEVAAAASTAAP